MVLRNQKLDEYYAQKKPILKTLKPDPIFNSTVVSRFTNMIMVDGKKRTAENYICCIRYNQ